MSGFTVNQGLVYSCLGPRVIVEHWNSGIATPLSLAGRACNL